MEDRKFLKLNNLENITYKHLRDTTKVELGKKFIVLNAYIGKQGGLKINEPRIQLRK